MPAIAEPGSIRSGALRRSVERLTPGKWRPITVFTNSWVNFDAAVTPRNAKYRKLSADLVELRGIIKSGTSGTDAFTLPPEFAPPADLAYIVSTSGGVGRLLVQSTGACQAQVLTGTNGQFWLNVIFSTTV